MITFQRNFQIVLSYLEKYDEKPDSIRLHQACYSQIGVFLKERSILYSHENALEWLREQSGPKALMGTFATAVARINDVYQSGHVRFQHRVRKQLCPAFESIIEEYLKDVSEQYSKKHLPNIRTRCRFLLFFMEMERGRCTIESISYYDILAFCREALSDLCKADSCMYKASAMEFLSWLAARGRCTRGFSLLLFKNRATKVLTLENMPSESAKSVLELKEPSFRDFPPKEFYEATVDFCNDLEGFGYAQTMMVTSRTTLDLLFVFLDMNRLGYDPVIAREWFKTAHVFFGSNSDMSRRVIMLFEGFIQEGRAHPEIRFIYKKKLCEFLPEWSRIHLYSFLEQKKREGKAASTVVMYRSAITRFCLFLEKEGLSSFGELTARHLKDFNFSDRHGTVEGKNAYNVRIRKFLLYLAMQGVLSNWFLGEALPCASAPKTRIVQVLSEEEYESLENYECGTDEALRLRNRAIVLMGLKMGLRISDIVSLKMGQIDWNGMVISFVQEKTGVGKLLPMPVEVGNALFRYLTEGLPRSGPGDRHIFITHKAPYRKITRSVCGNIMDKAVPKGKGGSRPGFHATRKTYATGRFRNGCGFPEVADLLGHSSNDTVGKYISLDEERMRMCPISMEAAGISMKGGFRHG